MILGSLPDFEKSSRPSILKRSVYDSMVKRNRAENWKLFLEHPEYIIRTYLWNHADQEKIIRNRILETRYVDMLNNTLKLMKQMKRLYEKIGLDGEFTRDDVETNEELIRKVGQLIGSKEKDIHRLLGRIIDKWNGMKKIRTGQKKIDGIKMDYRWTLEGPYEGYLVI